MTSVLIRDSWRGDTEEEQDGSDAVIVQDRPCTWPFGHLGSRLPASRRGRLSAVLSRRVGANAAWQPQEVALRARRGLVLMRLDPYEAEGGRRAAHTWGSSSGPRPSPPSTPPPPVLSRPLVSARWPCPPSASVSSHCPALGPASPPTPFLGTRSAEVPEVSPPPPTAPAGLPCPPVHDAPRLALRVAALPWLWALPLLEPAPLACSVRPWGPQAALRGPTPACPHF